MIPSRRILLALGLGLAAVLVAGLAAWLAPAGPTPSASEDEARFRDTDPDELISVRSPADVARLREELRSFLWGSRGGPADLGVARVESEPDALPFERPAVARSVSRLVVEMDRGLESRAYLLEARGPARGLVLLHSGHEGGPLVDVARALLGADLDVALLAMPLTVDNPSPTVAGPRGAPTPIETHEQLRELPPAQGSPLSYFVEPVAVVLNTCLARRDYGRIAMVGHSGGGWTTVLAAAVDERLQRSYPVAGSLPLYLRSARYRDLGDWEQREPELYRRASYLDLYVLGASGPGRRQLQLFCTKDPCCFSGERANLYAAKVARAVEQTGSGSFAVAYDREHPRHSVSQALLELILSELAPADARPLPG